MSHIIENNDTALPTSNNIFAKSTPPKLTNIYGMYKIFLLSSFILHIVYTLLFFSCKFQYLAIYNIIATSIYIFSHYAFKLKRMSVIFTIVNIELLLFIVVNTIILGWNYNFYLFYFLAIELTLFSCISRTRDLYMLKAALAQFAILTISVIVAYTYSHSSDPIYVVLKNNETIFSVISIINFVFVSAMIFLLNFALLADVNVSNKRLESTNNELNHIATHDPLTNLLNRRSMNEYFYKAIDNYKVNRDPFCLIIADIDDFKKVNDIFGHDSGDIVLKRISKIISDVIAKSGVVCRWGGEEILILVYCDLHEASKIAEEVRGAVAATSFMFNNNYIKSTITLGVAQYNPAFPISKVITNADEKLYQGKMSTKNWVVA